jgi:hypothetical protein
MLELQPGQNLPTHKHCLFLAGSIDMGVASNWQAHVIESLIDTNWTILNPRREDWDESWEQNKDNAEFRRQVEWELAAQEQAEVILMYFEPHSKAPVSLLELGLFARTGKMIVVCPEGYWRKGNIDIVCEKYNVKQLASLTEAVDHLKGL